MAGGFTPCKIWIRLQILTYLIVMVIAAKAKVKGTFKCTPPRHKVITCQDDHLPTVNAGVFKCSGYSVGGKCNLTCDDGYYPSATKYTVCEGYDDDKANWTVGTFQCSEITCLTTNLPSITDGSFDCAPNTDVSIGDVCALSCDDGFYAADTDQVVCEAGMTDQEGKWSDGNFVCRVITCKDDHLPTVNDGSFNCSDYSVGGKCNLTCDDGYYPSATKYTVCKGYDDHKANWTVGEFQCSVITCQDAQLPTVSNGSFKCFGYSVGGKCDLTCDDGYYPSATKYTVCEEYDDHKANWTVGEFQCSVITCKDVHLPTVNDGSFNCSGYSVGGKCNLTCDEGYYPSATKYTVCEEYDDYKANWTVGIFQCSELTCLTTTLPSITDGSFECGANTDLSIGESCALMCKDGFYPASSNQVVCEAGTTHQEGKWSEGSFVCRECNDWNAWNGSEYKYTRTKQTWEESRQSCLDEDSDLVTIENKEENDFVHKIVRYCLYGWTWIGLNDLNTEGTWEWSDGTFSTYTNWQEGQPNGGDAQDCVCMKRENGEWHDCSCNYGHLYAICERNNSLT